ncbi:MAG: hypothetical protein GXC70_05325 [Sphingomonadaceae bacterium]|nr:hypothetical protein [Sphingomonadaceae bacterium]
MPSIRIASLAALLYLLPGCSTGAAIQPDRSVFMLDNNYQRHSYPWPIETTFDQTVATFRESGYRLDVADRATGQLSGRRGKTGDKGVAADKDLKFYALVLPREDGTSELGIKIVQVIKSGPFGSSQAEIIVSDPQMYRYLFRRIETAPSQKAAALPDPASTGTASELPPR